MLSQSQRPHGRNKPLPKSRSAATGAATITAQSRSAAPAPEWTPAQAYGETSNFTRLMSWPEPLSRSARQRPGAGAVFDVAVR
jgi:hypothetical protein